MNFLISKEIKGKIVILIFIIAAIALPILLKNTNTLCRIAVAFLPIICGFIITIIFHSDYRYWPWQFKKRSSK